MCGGRTVFCALSADKTGVNSDDEGVVDDIDAAGVGMGGEAATGIAPLTTAAAAVLGAGAIVKSTVSLF